MGASAIARTSNSNVGRTSTSGLRRLGKHLSPRAGRRRRGSGLDAADRRIASEVAWPPAGYAICATYRLPVPYEVGRARHRNEALIQPQTSVPTRERWFSVNL